MATRRTCCAAEAIRRLANDLKDAPSAVVVDERQEIGVRGAIRQFDLLEPAKHYTIVIERDGMKYEFLGAMCVASLKGRAEAEVVRANDGTAQIVATSLEPSE